MKFRVTLKEPDSFHDAIKFAAEKEFKSSFSGDEKEASADEIKEEIKTFLEKWVRYSEYITVEFDTELGTATVCEIKS
ncbi:MAG: hypothetical protein AABY22_05545 [Nanoarchaeota archaeon]